MISKMDKPSLKLASPRRPETLPPTSISALASSKGRRTGMGEYFNKIRFEPYRSTRPQLLEELKQILQEGRAKVEQTGGDMSEAEKQVLHLEYCRLAFQRYIDESNIYKETLIHIKEYYERALNSFEHEHYECLRLQVELNKKDNEFNRQKNVLNTEWDSKLSLQEQTIVGLRKENLEKSRGVKVLEAANQQLEARVSEMSGERNELKRTCVILSKAMKGLEERDHEFQEQAERLKCEIQSMHESEAASQEEITRLRTVVQRLETYQATLLPRSVYDEQQGKIAHLETSLEAVRVNNKQLLFRYITLKGAIAKVSSYQLCLL